MVIPPQKNGATVDPKNLQPADKKAIALQCKTQLTTSRQFKRARFTDIQENENLYYNIVQKQIRNPFNECYPYMAGFIDHLKAKIDDDSDLLFKHTAESDLTRANKINAFFDMQSDDPSADGSWGIKHRLAKTNALFSGVAIYLYYAESNPDYHSCLDVISHYDFHCEPRGGAILENHLFCGQDNVYRNVEDLIDNDSYDAGQVTKITSSAVNGIKDNDDYDAIRNNRLRILKQDAVTQNYVGQNVMKLVSWYTTYKNVRYYCLFHEGSGEWLRVCPLTELFPENLWPYVTWHTNEDPDIFWSKAPADDARGVAKIINMFLNQELYNRQKQNYGETFFDADMVPNVQQLVDPRPDKHVAIDTKGGNRELSKAIYRPTTQGLTNSLELINWLEAFTGKQIGYTSSSAGESESDKKVGVYQGEVQQVEELIGIKNKSYADALSRLGLLFKQGLDHNLTKEVSIKMIGAEGVEWTKLTPADLKLESPLSIEPIGGTSEMALQKAKDQQKAVALGDAAMIPGGVAPQWLARQELLLAGFTEEDLKDAFSTDSFAKKNLLSEAAEAEKKIVLGQDPYLNRGADTYFMQHIIDFANDAYPAATPDQENKMSPEDKKQYDADTVVYQKLMAYATAHTEISTENEARAMKEAIRKKNLTAMLSAPPVQGAQIPTRPGTPIAPQPQAAPVPGL